MNPQWTPCSEDAHIKEREYKEDVVVESVTEEELEEEAAEKPQITGRSDENTIRAVSKIEIPVHAGEFELRLYDCF